MPLDIHAIVEDPNNQNAILLDHIDHEGATMMVDTNGRRKFGALSTDEWGLAKNLKTVF